MALNLGNIIGGLEKVVSAIAEMAPVAAKLGGPVVANVATVAIATTAIIHNLLERGKDVKEALASKDEGHLRAMLTDLQAANDMLNGKVEAS